MFPLLGLIAVAFGASNPTEPQILQDCKFGEVYSFSATECTAHVVNNAAVPVQLLVKPTWPGDSVSSADVTIPAKGTLDIPLRLSIGNHVGLLTRFFSVEPASGTGRKSYLKAEGFVTTALDQPNLKIDFGSVAINTSNSPEEQLSLASQETPAFRIIRLLGVPEQVEAKIAPDAHTIKLKLKPNAAWGVFNGTLKLSIDTPRQKEVWVGVHGEIHGDVAADANPVSLGILAAGREQMFELTVLRHKENQEFRTGKIRVEGIDGHADAAPCAKPEAGCKALRLTISSTQAPGLIRGKVFVELPDLGKTLPVDIEGFFTSEHTASEAGTSETAASTSVPSHIVQPAPSVGHDGVEADTETGARETPVAPPPGAGPLLRWSSSDERAVHGYQVFRSASEAGTFVLLNVPAIPAKSTRKSGAKYQWRDTSAKQGETYWYYIGVVYNDGRKERLMAPHRAIAK